MDSGELEEIVYYLGLLKQRGSAINSSHSMTRGMARSGISTDIHNLQPMNALKMKC